MWNNVNNRRNGKAKALIMKQFSNIIDYMSLGLCFACFILSILNKDLTSGLGWFVSFTAYMRIVAYKTT